MIKQALRVWVNLPWNQQQTWIPTPVLPEVGETFNRVEDPMIWRINDITPLTTAHLEVCFEVDEVILPCIHVADPEVVKRPEPGDIYRPPDYGNINRPQDNPNIDHPLDDPVMDRQ